MQHLTKTQYFFRDFTTTIQNYRDVLPFIRKHQLWKGLGHYGWAINLMIIVGALLGLKLFDFFSDWYSQLSAEGLSIAAMGSMMSNLASEGYELFVMGGFKYVILIVLEIVIFHFARITHEKLSGEKADASLRSFVHAQVRMIKVTFYCFVMETVFSAIAKGLLGAFDMGFFEYFLILLIQCYFMGFAVIDNYNEIYKLSIKESARYTRIYSGVALGIGFVFYVLMLLPVLGTVLAPLLGAVVATITMYQLEEKDQKILAAVERSRAE
ncbi:MAG: EI24 domain-containing protein [Bacteroidota bacterium]